MADITTATSRWKLQKIERSKKEKFRKLIDIATVEYMLLTGDTEEMNHADTLSALLSYCGRVTVDVQELTQRVKIYTVYISVNRTPRRKFVGESIHQATTEALTFAKICDTELGREACKMYDEYADEW